MPPLAPTGTYVVVLRDGTLLPYFAPDHKDAARRRVEAVYGWRVREALDCVPRGDHYLCHYGREVFAVYTSDAVPGGRELFAAFSAEVEHA